ncbi:bactofilin family protein [Ruegeria atlantica]|uniref:bactofilin family protein n=1 Tax=Ruegeria atlantica TaxID=81569 RepID=UPI00147E015E|nr:polymer-forming cytoskeletal protein [Ruegeria atlantica]
MTATVIQKDLTIQGDLVANEGTISVAGNVTGNVDAKSVDVLASGTVKGGIQAEEVKIAGGVEGSVKSRALAIEEKGELKADVTTGTMTMSSGAKISGRVDVRGG